MNRRIALQRVSLLMGGTLSAGTIMAVLGGCGNEATSTAETGALFQSSEQQLVADIAEIIIPTTDTPGAKEAGVGPFIETMLKDCYSETQQKNFKAGLMRVEEEAKKFGNSFVALSPEKQTEVLKIMETLAMEEKSKVQEPKNIDVESGLEKRDANTPETPTPFFQLMKELTLFGYFSSEIGATQALAYDPIPKAYHGCIDLAPGQKAWAL